MGPAIRQRVRQWFIGGTIMFIGCLVVFAVLEPPVNFGKAAFIAIFTATFGTLGSELVDRYLVKK